MWLEFHSPGCICAIFAMKREAHKWLKAQKKGLQSPSVWVMLRSVACKSEEMRSRERDDSVSLAFHQSGSPAFPHDCPITSHPYTDGCLFWGTCSWWFPYRPMRSVKEGEPTQKHAIIATHSKRECSLIKVCASLSLFLLSNWSGFKRHFAFSTGSFLQCTQLFSVTWNSSLCRLMWLSSATKQIVIFPVMLHLFETLCRKANGSVKANIDVANVCVAELNKFVFCILQKRWTSICQWWHVVHSRVWLWQSYSVPSC